MFREPHGQSLIAETTTQKCQSTTPTTKPSVAKPSSAFTESPSLSPPISPLSASISSNSLSPPTSVPLSKQPMTGFPSSAPPLPSTPLVVPISPISPPATPVLPLVFEFKTNTLQSTVTKFTPLIVSI
ncbi:hypothetical protein LOK49_LG15G02332 [Camellia lanceoleosa]|uniref:Uncharacterized protein n=1 Tax=Camellia lanceoleosa TaxID=1840588 RepID=A0ACC0F155_9ERIC|nr:hypothetical protein LOK49_LG15G02332 [Camellia lanceoleosa]